MSEKILPCPFCGGEAIVRTIYEKIDHEIFCTKCHMGCDRYRSDKEAIAAWNKRFQPRCIDCIHWDQYSDQEITDEGDIKIIGESNKGGCYQFIPVKTTEIGVITRMDFYCKHFEKKK